MHLKFGDTTLSLEAPIVMGVLNVTPDSFSDGGRYLSPENALRRAREMLDEGVDIVDVGGESTRPGADSVSTEEELQRVIPIIEALAADIPVPVSIDTSKAEVMRAAVTAGAAMINDVYALRSPGALETAVACDVPVCLMHMQGEPRTMQLAPHYDNVVEDVAGFLQGRVDEAVAAGIDPGKVIIDPGFGFGKSLDHNLVLLRSLPRLLQSGYPVLVGMSRKSMIGALLDTPVDNRLHGSIALAVIAAIQGAHIIRVHDVKATRDALRIVRAVYQSDS
ncbi:MAG: dihydropteroate synthase [Gammaproteobacteria bacterium]|nr:dihydropteroate synthase [Gammaproteobacteria bacterium]